MRSARAQRNNKMKYLLPDLSIESLSNRIDDATNNIAATTREIECLQQYVDEQYAMIAELSKQRARLIAMRDSAPEAEE